MVFHVLLATDRLALERPWRAWDSAGALVLSIKIKQEDWDKVERNFECYTVEQIHESESPVGL